MNENINVYLLYRKTFLKNIYCLSKMFDDVMEYEEYKNYYLHHKRNNYKYCHYLDKVRLCLEFILNLNSSIFDAKIVEYLIGILLDKVVNLEKVFNYNEHRLYRNINEILCYLNSENIYDKYICLYVYIVYLMKTNHNKIFKFSNRFFRKLFNCVQKDEYSTLQEVILEVEDKNIYPDESYYQNLKMITKEEILNYLILNKEMIRNKFKIKHLYLFGSFSKGTERIDSDIDLVAIFENGLTYKEKINYINNFKKEILKEFNRYGDITEYVYQLIKDEVHQKIY